MIAEKLDQVAIAEKLDQVAIAEKTGSGCDRRKEWTRLRPQKRLDQVAIAE